MNKTFLIIGEGRSGTSLTAHILKEMGVNMGDRLKGANHGNKDGYWENPDFVNMNIKIIEDNEFDINQYPVPRPALVQARVEDKYNKEIESLVKKYQRGVWGAKDPRFLYTYPLYEPYLEDVHFVVCYRNPISVALSLRYQDNKDIMSSLRVINDYYRVLYDFFERDHNPRFLVSYEKYFDSNKQIEDLCKFVGLDYSPNFDKLVKPTLKNF